MSEDWKVGRLEGWKHKTCGGKNSSFHASIHPSIHSSKLPFFHSSSGFSLLEVLVALAIFGIAAGGILVALGHHLKNVSFLQDHSRAVRIASREINALRRMTSLPEDVTEGSEGRFIWTSQVSTEGLEEWPGLDGASGTPVLLKVTVQWSDNEGGPFTGKVHLDGFEVF